MPLRPLGSPCVAGCEDSVTWCHSFNPHSSSMRKAPSGTARVGLLVQVTQEGSGRTQTPDSRSEPLTLRHRKSGTHPPSSSPALTQPTWGIRSAPRQPYFRILGLNPALCRLQHSDKIHPPTLKYDLPKRSHGELNILHFK